MIDSYTKHWGPHLYCNTSKWNLNKPWGPTLPLHLKKIWKAIGIMIWVRSCLNKRNKWNLWHLSATGLNIRFQITYRNISNRKGFKGIDAIYSKRGLQTPGICDRHLFSLRPKLIISFELKYYKVSVLDLETIYVLFLCTKKWKI